MYGANPAVHLASPPFEVESYLNQNIQAADWVAALVGRVFAYRIAQQEYVDLEPYEKYFGARLGAVATHSTVMQRRIKKQSLRVEQTTTFVRYERGVILKSAE